MVLNVHEHRAMIIDIVFWIGLAQFIIGACTFLINDYSVLNLISWADGAYNLPEWIDIVAYLILMNLTTISAILVFVVPGVKYYVYEIYLEVENHGIDWELWTDITKSCIMAVTWIYSLVVTGYALL